MQSMYTYYANEFVSLNEQGKDGYLLLCSTVCVKLLSELYRKFISEGIEPIENLSKEKKLKYWNAAKKYWQTEPEAIKASKACYVLDLITSTD